MKIAVEGCTHGALDEIYDTIKYLEKQNNVKVDLLICCGDFQATRNVDDLSCMAVPPKFREMCSFYKYYSGEKVAPILTICIGGNHEASNHFQELPYGGWVAPKIYYMGYASVVNIAGIRIAGLSGIFKGKDFCKGRFEKPPYNGDAMRSVYHVRNLEVFRLKQLSHKMDVCLSHDWPTGMAQHGDKARLLQKKPYFKDEVESNTLGSPPAAELLTALRPSYWFSGHFHCKFAALVPHPQDDESKEKAEATKFLGLDKCLPRKHFLQIVDIAHDEQQPLKLKYDLEWLTVLRLTNHLLSVERLNCYMPGPGSDERWKFTPTETELEETRQRYPGGLEIPENFVQTAPVFEPGNNGNATGNLQPRISPQTTAFCDKLGIDDPMLLLDGSINRSIDTSQTASYLETSSFIATDCEEGEGGGGAFRTPLKLPQLKGGGGRVSVGWTPLKLPEPVVASTPSDDTSWEEREKSVASNSIEETSETSRRETESSGEVTVSGPKRLKRRNIAMYAAQDDE